jgi:hypothetical protein
MLQMEWFVARTHARLTYIRSELPLKLIVWVCVIRWPLRLHSQRDLQTQGDLCPIPRFVFRRLYFVCGPNPRMNREM